MRKLIIDPTKVKYDGSSFELIVKDEESLIKGLKEKQKEIMKNLNLVPVEDEKKSEMDPILNLTETLKRLGYNLSGSIFKVDFNGKLWNLGLWVSSQRYNKKTNSYELPSICHKVKKESYNEALNELLEFAYERIRNLN